jgi:hypothetical protein
VRDPRDVVVSAYFQATKRRRAYSGDLSSFLWADPGGFASIIAYYNAWAGARPPQFLVVRYEDLHADATSELTRVLRFFDMQVPTDSVERAATAGAFANMRRLEQTEQLPGVRLRPGNRGDPESFKTRKGKVGGHVDYLSRVQLTSLTRYMAEHLDSEFGY